MTNIFKTLIVSSAFIALSGTALSGAALAGEPTSTTFKYNASAPVEVTYAQFQQTAERACNFRHSVAFGRAGKDRVEKKCEAQLVAAAVAATKIKTLLAYHNQQIGVKAEERKFARLRQDNPQN